MTDERTTTAFDARFARMLHSYADAGVRPLDPSTVARRVTSEHPRQTTRFVPAISGRFLRLLLVGAVLAALVTGWLLAGGLRQAPAFSSREALVWASDHVSIVNPQGRITDLGAGRWPAWSGDHTIVVFSDNTSRLIAVDRVTGTRSDLGPAGTWITVSTDGRWILMGAAGYKFILVDRVSRTRSTLSHVGQKEPDGAVAWSPIGDQAVAVIRDGLLMIDASTSPATERIIGRERFANDRPSADVAVGLDDRIAFVAAGGLFLMDADGGGEQLVARSSAHQTLERPAWSPDGTTLAFVANGDGGHVSLVDLASNAVRDLPAEPQDATIEGVGWVSDGELRVVLTKLTHPGNVSVDTQRTIVQWLALDGSVRAQLDLGLGVQTVVPAAPEVNP